MQIFKDFAVLYSIFVVECLANHLPPNHKCRGRNQADEKDPEIEKLKSELPSNLNLTLPVSNTSNITLYLVKTQKDALNDSDILVIVSDHDSERLWKPKGKEALGSYSDINGSTFEVVLSKEGNKTKAIYFGMFVHGNESFVVIPESESDNVSTAYKVTLNNTVYNVFHNPDRMNFGNDEKEVKNVPETERLTTSIPMTISTTTTTTLTLTTSSTTSSTNPRDKTITETLRTTKKCVTGSKTPNVTQTEDRSERVKRAPKKKSSGKIDWNSKNIIIDILTVVDYSIYKTWLGYNKNDEEKAVANIKYYFAQVVNGISNKYKTIESSKYGYRYSTRLSVLFIATSSVDSSFTEGANVKYGYNEIDLSTALTEFTKWVKMKVAQNKLPKYDVAAAFTRYEGTGPAGIAKLGTTCQHDATSITRDNGVYGTVNTAAHEIGHNMGANHDGETNYCRASDQYLMAAVEESVEINNHHTFSSCSINYFDQLVQKLDRSGRNCLRMKHGTYDDITSHLKVHPGQVFKVKQQCQFRYGPNSYFCSYGEDSDETICEKMYCMDKKRNECLGGPSLRAYDGTSCGNKKWCMGGKCVYDSNAPTNKDKCIFGDYTQPIDYNYRPTKCSDLKRQRFVCDDPTMAKWCCKTCAEIKKRPQVGCQKGDYNYYSNCNEILYPDIRRSCQQKYYQDGCCQSCYPYIRRG